MNKFYFIFLLTFLIISNSAKAEKMILAKRNTPEFNELLEKGYIPFVGGEDIGGEKRVVCRTPQNKNPGKEVGDLCHTFCNKPVKDYEIYMINKNEDPVFMYRWISKDVLNKLIPTLPGEMKEASHIYYLIDQEVIQTDFLRETISGNTLLLQSTVRLISRSKRIIPTSESEPGKQYIYQGIHTGHANFDVKSMQISSNHYSFGSDSCQGKSQQDKDRLKDISEKIKLSFKDKKSSFMDDSKIQFLENSQMLPDEETEILCKVSNLIYPAMKGNLNYKIIDLLFNEK